MIREQIVNKYAEMMVAKYGGQERFSDYYNHINKQFDAISNKDMPELIQSLHIGNKITLKIFNDVMGRKVKTSKDIELALRSIDNEAYQQYFDNKKMEKEKKEQEYKEKDFIAKLQRKIKSDGIISTEQQMIDRVIADGYVEYSEKKRGVSTVADLCKGSSFYRFNTSASIWYIKKKLQKG